MGVVRKPDEAALEPESLRRVQLFLYLMPVFGIVPALWTLYRYQQSSQQQKTLSRITLFLTTGWLLGYSLLGLGVEASDSLSLPLLLTSSLLTSGYFLVNLLLMVRLWQRKPIELPWERSPTARRSRYPQNSRKR